MSVTMLSIYSETSNLIIAWGQCSNHRSHKAAVCWPVASKQSHQCCCWLLFCSIKHESTRCKQPKAHLSTYPKSTLCGTKKRFLSKNYKSHKSVPQMKRCHENSVNWVFGRSVRWEVNKSSTQDYENMQFSCEFYAGKLYATCTDRHGNTPTHLHTHTYTHRG